MVSDGIVSLEISVAFAKECAGLTGRRGVLETLACMQDSKE
jgi:hypothetical protein